MIQIKSGRVRFLAVVLPQLLLSTGVTVLAAPDRAPGDPHYVSFAPGHAETKGLVVYRLVGFGPGSPESRFQTMAESYEPPKGDNATQADGSGYRVTRQSLDTGEVWKVVTMFATRADAGGSSMLTVSNQEKISIVNPQRVRFEAIVFDSEGRELLKAPLPIELAPGEWRLQVRIVRD